MGCICEKIQIEDKIVNLNSDINNNEENNKEENSRFYQNYQMSSNYRVMNNNSYSLNFQEIFDIKEPRKTKTTRYIKSKSFYSKFSLKFKFSENILKEINEARRDCELFSLKVDEFAEKIQKEKKQSFILLKNGFKVELVKGEGAFRGCSIHLRDLDNSLVDKFRGLQDLVEISELKVPFPVDDNVDFLDADYIKKCQQELVNKIQGKYELVEFVYQITVNDPELAVILNVVDENTPNKKVRECILSEEIKYIGINSKKIDENLIAVYMIFAK